MIIKMLGLTQHFISFFKRIRRFIAFISAILLVFFAFMSSDPLEMPGLLFFKRENLIALSKDISDSKSGLTAMSKRNITYDPNKGVDVLKRNIRNLRKALDRSDIIGDYSDYITDRIEKESENDMRERNENIARAYREEAKKEGTTPPY